MKKKSDLLVLAIAMVSVLFIVILFTVASASKSEIKSVEEDVILLEEDETVQKEETAQESAETLTEPLSKDGAFTFAVDGFDKQFLENLPEGYTFMNAVAANSSRDNRMQLDIVDAAGAATNIAVVFNVQESDVSCEQMALAIKEDCFEDNAAAILQWYLTTFLEEFGEEERRVIYEDYLDMFHNKADDYRVYSEESLAVMMCRETEETGTYYYILMSAQ